MMKKLICLAAALISSAVFAGEKPNVLMIAIDDLRPELNCYGTSHIISPNIDAFAKESLLFERAYCQVAVCGASRASLLSGTRPETTTIWDYKTPMRSKLPDIRSLPQHFKESGYTTISLGKIYHAKDDDFPQGWSGRPGKSKKSGYVQPYERVPHKTQKGRFMGPSIENGGDVPDNAYSDGGVAEMAVKKLERFAKSDESFFLAVGFTKPHLPFNAPGKYWDLYDRSKIEVPSRDQPLNSPLYARSTWGELKNYTDIGAKVTELDDAKTRELIHGYYAATSYTDRNVGHVLKALERLNLKGNTIVILWGDHGWYLGEYGDWCKHSNDEIAAHVPMILRVPGKTDGGMRTKALSELVDIYPTLSELCGLEIPKHCEGDSMVPLLENPNRAWKAVAFSQYQKKDFKRTLVFLGTSVRDQQWRYTEWRDVKTDKLDRVELYDLKSDPNQTISVHGDPKNAPLLEKLAALAAKSATGVSPPSH